MENNYFTKTVRRILVPCVFILIFAPVAFLQSMRWIGGYLDTAFLSQTVENIAANGSAVSQVVASWPNARGLFATPADEVCRTTLSPPENAEPSILKSHTYFILYIIAPLAKFIPVNILLPSLTVAGFLLLLFTSYVFLRRHDVSSLGSFLFCLLVSVHPVWSQGILGQIYVDRYFLPLGMLFLFVLTEEKQNWLWILAVGILCLSVVERIGITLGIIAMGYALLYWQRPFKSRLFIFSLGITFIFFSFLILKLYLNHPDYNSFLANIGANFEYPGFVDKLKVFFLFNMLFIGIFAIFDWRAFLLATVAMMPNIFGNIGGAEKTGWLTHYHSLYFPILVWASAMGFIKLSNILGLKFKKKILYLFTFFLTILCSSTFLYITDGDQSRFSVENMKENAWVRTAFMLCDFARNGKHSGIGSMLERYHKIQRIIPEHCVVTTGESMMPALYRNRTIYYYPIGIDVADYAVLPFRTEPDGRILYKGATSYLGNDNLERLEICLNERLRRAGYEVGNPVIVGDIAILRRLAPKAPSIR